MQLIPSDSVAAARERPSLYIPSDPLVVGVDVARFGDDASVLFPRRGRDARTLPIKRWRGIDNMALAGEIAMWDKEFHPDAIFIDIGGTGTGVFDRCIQLQMRNVYPVNFGGAGWEVQWNGVGIRTANMRAAMWCSMREWLAMGSIPDETQLEQDLTGVQYFYTADQAIQLEPKEAMKRRGLASPDEGDSLALTFAMTVAPRGIDAIGINPRTGVTTDYDMFADA